MLPTKYLEPKPSICSKWFTNIKEGINAHKTHIIGITLANTSGLV